MANELQYITEDLQGMLALIYNGECVGIQLPAAVDLKITECDPAVKGNSATSRTKPAKLETGVIVQVPEYLEAGRDDSRRHAQRRVPGAGVNQLNRQQKRSRRPWADGSCSSFSNRRAAT